jgi:hypothetical protein
MLGLQANFVIKVVPALARAVRQGGCLTGSAIVNESQNRVAPACCRDTLTRNVPPMLTLCCNLGQKRAPAPQNDIYSSGRAAAPARRTCHSSQVALPPLPAATPLPVATTQIPGLILEGRRQLLQAFLESCLSCEACVQVHP